LRVSGSRPARTNAALDAVAQMDQRRVLLDAEPQHAGLLALAELVEPRSTQLEAGRANLAERREHVVICRGGRPRR